MDSAEKHSGKTSITKGFDESDKNKLRLLFERIRIREKYEWLSKPKGKKGRPH